jgi:Lar family restriction alleviation protein
MINWIKKQWQSFEQKNDEKLQQYLESITLKDAKPCPFCGETTIRYFYHKTALIGGLKIYRATCTKCGATIGQALSKESAKRKWNQRTGDKQ